MTDSQKLMNTPNASKGPNRDVSTEPSHAWANLLRRGASPSLGRLRGWAISRVCDIRDVFTKLAILRRMLLGIFEQWCDDVWKQDLDAPYCCNGYMCGCRASTVREIYTHKHN